MRYKLHVTVKVNSAICLLLLLVLLNSKREELGLVIEKRGAVALEISWRLPLTHKSEGSTENVEVKRFFVRQVLFNQTILLNNGSMCLRVVLHHSFELSFDFTAFDCLLEDVVHQTK